MIRYSVTELVMEITCKLIIILTTSPELLFLCGKNMATTYLHTTNENEI